MSLFLVQEKECRSAARYALANFQERRLRIRPWATLGTGSNLPASILRHALAEPSPASHDSADVQPDNFEIVLGQPGTFMLDPGAASQAHPWQGDEPAQSFVDHRIDPKVSPVVHWVPAPLNLLSSDGQPGIVADLDFILASLAHDMRAPLRSLNQLADELCAGSGHLAAEDLHEFAGTLRCRVSRLQEMLTSTMQLTRLSPSALDDPEVDLNDVVRDVIETHAIIIRSRNASVDVRSPLPVVHGPRGLLLRILSNLVANGILHNSGPAPAVGVGCVSSATHHEIWVQDDGDGLPDDIIAWLRACEGGNRLQVIAGAQRHLGLSIAVLAARRLDVRLTVAARREGRGTQVCVRFPRRRNSQEGA